MKNRRYVFLGLFGVLILAHFAGFAPGQILRRRLERKMEEKKAQGERNAHVDAKAAAPGCDATLNLGFHIQTYSSGLRAAVWYPTKSAEAPYHYADNILSALAQDAPVADCGPYPVVIFSHGFGGCGTQSTFFTETLARAGYIVIAPDHKDAQCKIDQPRQRQGRMMMHRAEEPFHRSSKWDESTYRDREQDIKIILSEMADDRVVGKQVDMNHIGGAGHSLGGYTMAGVAGAWPSWKDDRIKAVLLMSPYIKPYVDKGTLQAMKVPVMYEGGTRDFGITPSVKKSGGAYDMSGPPKFFAEFKDAGHLGWTIYTCMTYGATASCDQQSPLARLIDQYGIGFFNRFLKGRPEEFLDRSNSQLADYRHADLRRSD